jgi:hypothetical protein
MAPSIVRLAALLWLFASGIPCGAQASAAQVEATLQEHHSAITRAAGDFSVSPRLLAAVMFAEHSLNRKPGKSLAETFLAKCGYDSSIGIAQIRVSTAEWIERQVHDRTSPFALDATADARLPFSQTRGDLIQILEEPSGNLSYAAAYIAIIQKAWSAVLATPAIAPRRAGIIATLYSLGLRRPDGSIRGPHQDANTNTLGDVAQAFFDGDALRAEFPDGPVTP